MRQGPAFVAFALFAGCNFDHGQGVNRPQDAREIDAPTIDAAVIDSAMIDTMTVVTDAAVDAIAESAARMTSPHSLLALYQLGGAARLAEAAFCLNVAATWTEPAEGERHIAWARGSWSAVEPHSTAGAYVNFLGEEGPDRTQAAYRQDYERLVALKNTYDPGNFFCLNQNIRPSVRSVPGPL